MISQPESSALNAMEFTIPDRDESLSLSTLPESAELVDAQSKWSASGGELGLRISVDSADSGYGSSPVLAKIDYDPAKLHFVSFIWSEELNGLDGTLKLAVDKGGGQMQFGVCRAGANPGSGIPLDIGTAVFATGPSRHISSLSDSALALSRVPDLEVIYFQEYDLNQDSAALDDVLLTWSSAMNSDLDGNGEVNIADMAALGQRFGDIQEVHFDYDLAFIPSYTAAKTNGSIFQSNIPQIDANKDGIINLSDLSSIGQNFKTNLYGWSAKHERSAELELDFDLSSSKTFIATSDEEFEGITYKVQALSKNKLRKYNYCQSVGATSGLISDITSIPIADHEFTLTSYFDPLNATDPQTADSLIRTAPYHGIESGIELSAAELDSDLQAGILLPVFVAGSPDESYIIACAAEDAPEPGTVAVYEFDYSGSPPAIGSTPESTLDITELASIHDAVCGDFGNGYNVAILGSEGSGESALVLFRLSSGTLSDKMAIALPIFGGIAEAGEFSVATGADKEEIFVLPDAESLDYRGVLLTFSSQSELFSTTLLPVGGGISAAMIEDFVFGTTSGPIGRDFLALTEKNGNSGDLFLMANFDYSSTPLSGLMNIPGATSNPLGGLLADYGRSLPDVQGWDLRKATSRPYLSTGMPGEIGTLTYMTLTTGFRDLPLFSHNRFESQTTSSPLVMTQDEFCLEIYRNLVDEDGELIDTRINGLEFCSLTSPIADFARPNRRDIAYITQDAIGWRMGEADRYFWSSTFDRLDTENYIGLDSEEDVITFDRKSTFGPIHLLGANDEDDFSPAHLAIAPLGGIGDEDDIIVSAEVDGGYKLIVLSFE